MLNNWVKVRGYPKYSVNQRGQVLSSRSNKVLKTDDNHKGRLMVRLYNSDGSKVFQVHRLVAQAFIPNPRNLKYVNHKDSNLKNNNVSNLEWCTSSYNMVHAYDSGSRKLLKRSKVQSRFRGISWSVVHKRWRAMVMKNGKSYFIGSFKLEDDAKKAYESFIKSNKFLKENV